VAELEARLANRRPAQPANEIGARQYRCYQCGNAGHIARNCPNNPPPIPHPNQGQPNSRPVPIAPYAERPQNVRPIHEKESRTCVNVKFGKYQVLALLDTGSGITVISSVLARRMRWKIFPHKLTSVKVANGEDMLLNGVAYVTLRVGTQDIDSEVLVSPDMTGLILGIDWMEQNECVFHCKEKQVHINNEWVELRREPSVQKIRKIYVPQDTVLPPSQQVEVDVRVRGDPNDPEIERGFGLLENGKVPGVAHVYNARCLVPLKNSGIKVALLKAQNRSQTLVKGTELGEVQIVEVVPEKVVDQEMQSEELSEPERDALQKIMEKLPSDLSKVQKQKVWNLLLKYRAIISVGDHDIGRTDLVEHHIDTGNSRPIRQPFRRHPF